MSLDQVLVDHGAPTLAGMKTGSLFPVKNGVEDINPELRRVNRLLAPRGLRLVPLRKSSRGTLVYLYRPQRLKKDLSYPEAADILRQKGYPCGHPDRCIVELIRQLESGGDFPHEIGLFLSYPPSDVKCFMKDSREGVKCVGCWKAYSHQEEAEKTFERYNRCTQVYRRVYKKGRSLERLIVSE
ncbi:MAG: DUF3793 family protein [Blautia sp.]|nr:DUF3793 family protein [Blautia sp.]